MKIRPLRAEEVECRVSQIVKDKGLFLLLYKDARCDMRILDEAVGPENWQREHFECAGRLFCRVGVKTHANEYDGNEWVWKSDCGAESNTEPEKGESSDSFKRACVNWGIGRELYTAPKIWIPSSLCTIKENSKGRLVCYDDFDVSSFEVTDGRITNLGISADGKVVFSWPRKKSNANRDQIEAIHEVASLLENASGKKASEWMNAALKSNAAKSCGVVPGKELTEEQAGRVIEQMRVWLEKYDGQ